MTTFIRTLLDDANAAAAIATLGGFGSAAGTFCEGNDVRLSDNRYTKLFAYQNTTQIHTGNTSPTIVFSVLIPGGTLGANGKIVIESLNSSNAGALAARTARVYLNDTNDLTTPTIIGTTQMIGTQITAGFRRSFVNKNSESLNEVFPSGAAASNDFNVSTTAISVINYDTSVDMYLIYAVQLTNALDTINLNNIQVYIEK